MGFELVGKVWDSVSFRAYIETVNLGWASSVTVHHTATPSLSQRPAGWTIQHMRNLQHFYQNKLGWSAGPHLFTDEDQIYGMSSLYRRGVHARSFNRTSIGIECLGNYDFEDPHTGRGELCWETTAQAVAILLVRMRLPVTSRTVKFHRDDPKTSKTCPGKLVKKGWFLDLVQSYVDTLTDYTHKDDQAGDTPQDVPPLTLEQLAARVAHLEQLAGVNPSKP